MARPLPFFVSAAFTIACSLSAPGCSSDTPTDGGPGPAFSAGGGHFYYEIEGKIFRIQASKGAQPENLSVKLNADSRGTRDRYLAASTDGKWLVFAGDRFGCESECLVRISSELKSGELIKPGGKEVSPRGMSVIATSGELVVYPADGGPHKADLYATRREGGGWSAPTLLTTASTYAYNNMAALTLDGKRVTFDCGEEPYPEGGNNDACEVGVDGQGFRKLVGRDALPNPRQKHVQNPHEGLDGVLFEAAWPVGDQSPEIVWLLPKGGGPPTPAGKVFPNSVAPCALPDGRWGILWLGGPGNTSGKHELTLVERDGSKGVVLTPGVDIGDTGVGCSD